MTTSSRFWIVSLLVLSALACGERAEQKPPAAEAPAAEP